MGTTSACAENTLCQAPACNPFGNYLRVRGEYAGPALTAGVLGELPPRARRILIADHGHNNLNGTTSACAENTVGGFIRRQIHGNYLRVRGEYPK